MEPSLQKGNTFRNIINCYLGVYGRVIAMNGSSCVIYFNICSCFPQFLSIQNALIM